MSERAPATLASSVHSTVQFHIHGHLGSFRTAFSEATIIVPARLRVFLEQGITARGATGYSATPTMYKLILSFPLPTTAPSFPCIRSCSSRLSAVILVALEIRFGAPLLVDYAMTEAAHELASNQFL